MLALVLFVTAVAGQTNPPTVPPKCCVARQYEVNMGETGGLLYNNHGQESPILLDTDNVMHYDYYNRTYVMEVNSHNPDNTTSYTRIIMDYKTRTQYVYVPSGRCTSSRTRRSFREPCIPDHASFLGHTTIGYGINSIEINTWQFPDPDTGNDIKMALTSETCVPVVEALVGVSDIIVTAPIEMAFVFTNFKPGLSKTGVFQLPDVCKNSNDVVETEDHPPHIRRAIVALETASA